jgi:hypothetical protein
VSCGKGNRWIPVTVRSQNPNTPDDATQLVEAADCVRRVLISGANLGLLTVQLGPVARFHTQGPAHFQVTAAITELYLAPGEELYAVVNGANGVVLQVRVEEYFDNVRQLGEWLKALLPSALRLLKRVA